MIMETMSEVLPPDKQSGPGLTNLGLVLLLFFLLFPIFLFGVGSSLLFEDPVLERTRVAENRLDNAIDRIEFDKNPDEYFSRFFRKIEKKVRTKPMETWKKVAPVLHRRFPGLLDLILVDGSGKPVPDFCDRIVPKHLLKKFFFGYQAFLAKKRPLSSIEEAFAVSFFGSITQTDGEFHSKFFQASPIPKLEYVYFSRPSSEGMFIVFFKPQGKTLRKCALEDQIARFNRRTGSMRLCLARTNDSSLDILNDLGIRSSVPENFWAILQKSAKGRIWFHDTLVCKRILFPNWWVVGTTRRDPAGTKIPFNPLRATLGVVLFFFAAALTGRSRLVTLFLGSVRVKLVAAFLYAAIVPLLIMGLTVQSFLADRKEVLTDELHEKTEKVLTDLDQRYRKFSSRISRLISLMRFPKGTGREETVAGFVNKFEKTSESLGFDWCLIFERSGKSTFEYVAPMSPLIPGNVRRILETMARDYLSQRDFQPWDGKNASLSGKPKKEITLGSAFSMINWSEERCSQVQLGPLRTACAPLLLTNPDSHDACIVFFIWDLKRLQWNYLKKELPSLSRKSDGGRFFVWSQENPDQRFPEDFSYNDAVKQVLPKVLSGFRSYRQYLPGSERQLVVTGLRGTHLDQFSMLCVNSTQNISAILRAQTWKFRFIAFAITGVCLIIGVFIAGLFVIPISRLKQGIEAFSNRNFEYRLEVHSSNELGKLARYFNQTLEDLKDLEVGKTVQNTFFPSKPLTVGGWRIFGDCIPAGQVGGDYFDYFPISDDCIMFLIGDVSGHGVGAGLVVAMVKAMIEHPATGGDPTAILQAINDSMFRILGRKKMMSLQISILNPATGVLTHGNAGHSFPILIRNGVGRFIELPGYPLGSRKSWKSNSLTLNLQPEDILVFFSDGIIEALDSDGLPIGYDRFLEELPGLLGSAPEQSVNTVREWLGSISPKLPPEDDMTLLIVQRSRPGVFS